MPRTNHAGPFRKTMPGRQRHARVPVDCAGVISADTTAHTVTDDRILDPNQSAAPWLTPARRGIPEQVQGIERPGHSRRFVAASRHAAGAATTEANFPGVLHDRHNGGGRPGRVQPGAVVCSCNSFATDARSAPCNRIKTPRERTGDVREARPRWRTCTPPSPCVAQARHGGA